MAPQLGITDYRTELFSVPYSSSVLFPYMKQIRKPYTITKQRERWTEEEHKKFLEALKLYGRAWRKIEGRFSRI